MIKLKMNLQNENARFQMLMAEKNCPSVNQNAKY